MSSRFVIRNLDIDALLAGGSLVRRWTSDPAKARIFSDRDAAKKHTATYLDDVPTVVEEVAAGQPAPGA